MMKFLSIGLALAVLALAGCAGPSTMMTASWYGEEQHQHLTASGARYNMYRYTAAHRTLALGTVLAVTNPQNGHAVRVVVTDRGPYVKGRDLDLSYAAAKELGLITSGLARVKVRVVGHDCRYDKYWKTHTPPPETPNSPPPPMTGPLEPEEPTTMTVSVSPPQSIRHE